MTPEKRAAFTIAFNWIGGLRIEYDTYEYKDAAGHPLRHSDCIFVFSEGCVRGWILQRVLSCFQEHADTN
jgi:hypothetical protein